MPSVMPSTVRIWYQTCRASLSTLGVSTNSPTLAGYWPMMPFVLQAVVQPQGEQPTHPGLGRVASPKQRRVTGRCRCLPPPRKSKWPLVYRAPALGCHKAAVKASPRGGDTPGRSGAPPPATARCNGCAGGHEPYSTSAIATLAMASASSVTAPANCSTELTLSRPAASSGGKAGGDWGMGRGRGQVLHIGSGWLAGRGHANTLPRRAWPLGGGALSQWRAACTSTATPLVQRRAVVVARQVP